MLFSPPFFSSAGSEAIREVVMLVIHYTFLFLFIHKPTIPFIFDPFPWLSSGKLIFFFCKSVEGKGSSRSLCKTFQAPFAHMEDFTLNQIVMVFFFLMVFLHSTSICPYTDNRCFDTQPLPAELELVSIRSGAQPLGELTVQAADRVIGI